MYSENADEDDLLCFDNQKSSEQIIFEFGAPQDFSGRRCSMMHNVWAMCCQTKIPNQMALYSRLTTKPVTLIANVSLMNINEHEPLAENNFYMPGSFSVENTAGILYQPFKYNDIDEESSVRIYETGFGNRQNNFDARRMSLISEEEY
jgi:hypothetical protein